MPRALTILTLIVLTTAVTPAGVGISKTPLTARTIRIEQPPGFSVPDALIGAGATGLLIAAVALLALRRSSNDR
jgi:hypothetical protein